MSMTLCSLLRIVSTVLRFVWFFATNTPFVVADPGVFRDYPEFDDELWCKIDDLGGKVSWLGCQDRVVTYPGLGLVCGIH